MINMGKVYLIGVGLGVVDFIMVCGMWLFE